MKTREQGVVFLKAESWRALFFFSVLAFLFYTLVSVNHLLASFIVALVMNCMIGPVIEVLERRGIERFHSIVGVFLVLTLVFFVFIFQFYPVLVSQLTFLKNEGPMYWKKILARLDLFQENLIQTGLFDDTNIFEVIKAPLLEGTPKIFGTLPALFSQSLTILVLAPFLSFFMLLDGKKVMKKIYEIVPNSIFEITLSLQSQINFQLGQFIRSRLIASFFVGIVVGLGLLSTHPSFSFSFAVFAGLANLIPYIGPVLSALPAILLGFVKAYGVFDFLFFFCLM